MHVVSHPDIGLTINFSSVKLHITNIIDFYDPDKITV